MPRTQTIESKIIKIMAELEPYMAGHGGSISFVSWDPITGVVEVALKGACQNCPMSHLTLKYGLEQALKTKILSIKEVKSV
ncbi:MAG: NifU family protein [Patescibacteria group bacterium]